MRDTSESPFVSWTVGQFGSDMTFKKITFVLVPAPVGKHYEEIVGTMCHICTSHVDMKRVCRKIMSTPDGMSCCHKCDRGQKSNDPLGICINPEHMWNGTHKENMEDMARKRRGTAGKVWTDEQRRGLSIVRTGKKHPCKSWTLEQKQQQSQRMLGKKRGSYKKKNT